MLCHGVNDRVLTAASGSGIILDAPSVLNHAASNNDLAMKIFVASSKYKLVAIIYYSLRASSGASPLPPCLPIDLNFSMGI